MDRRNAFPVVITALLSCVVLMLAVVGGLYAYNTFVAEAEPVHAQGGGASDQGPSWTASVVQVGGNQDYLVIISEEDNPLEEGQKTKQMAVYELKAGGEGKAKLFLVGCRTLAYDFKLVDEQEIGSSKKYSPSELKKAIDKMNKDK